jgi:hypothetical protein
MKFVLYIILIVLVFVWLNMETTENFNANAHSPIIDWPYIGNDAFPFLSLYYSPSMEGFCNGGTVYHPYQFDGYPYFRTEWGSDRFVMSVRGPKHQALQP